MAHVVGAVQGLLQGAQHHRLQQLVVGPTLDLLQQLGVVLGLGLVAAAQVQAEAAQEFPQALQLLLGRALVHPVQGRVVVLLQVLGGAHVGRQHAFLDDAMGVVAGVGHDFLDLALVVEDHLGLDRLEVDGAALRPGLGQHPVQRIQVLQMGQQRPQLGHRLRVIVVEGRRHLRIGQAGVGVHHRRIEAVTLDGAVGGDGHVAHHAQAFHLGIEGAQAVGQLLRKHGDHPAREIDRVAPLQGFGVQRAVRPHVVAHVGDGHHQPETAPAVAALALAIHGVVEVLGGLAVDGNQGQMAYVLAPLPVAPAYLVRQLLRFRQGLP